MQHKNSKNFVLTIKNTQQNSFSKSLRYKISKIKNNQKKKKLKNKQKKLNQKYQRRKTFYAPQCTYLPYIITHIQIYYYPNQQAWFKSSSCSCRQLISNTKQNKIHFTLNDDDDDKIHGFHHIHKMDNGRRAQYTQEQEQQQHLMELTLIGLWIRLQKKEEFVVLSYIVKYIINKQNKTNKQTKVM